MHHEDCFLFFDALVAFLIDFIITLSDFGKRFGHVLLRKSEQEGGCGIAGRCVLELGNQEVPADNGFRLAFRFSMMRKLVLVGKVVHILVLNAYGCVMLPAEI